MSFVERCPLNEVPSHLALAVTTHYPTCIIMVALSGCVTVPESSLSSTVVSFYCIPRYTDRETGAIHHTVMNYPYTSVH